ncbi:uncharacterized protein LOC111681650 [Lucilia cuprina]|uniref:uncharacterized protein LOC111681650 n=1 Tax=Lucilia cuprina TaxID=7375 RepID=UPI001F055839|nr:uncharacterized protein LOC111681650 [Lucilia cuprina]XP_046802233.1 uncharacterized protein LOC111681650 [Lucilia cuprina]
MMHFKIHLTICLIYLITHNKTDGRPIQEITETRNPPETQIPAGFSQATNEELKPSEIQKAVCTVTSGDVRASAEAFTTRELKGVCGSTEMLKSFHNLEQKLGQELQNIQKLIQDLHRQFVTKGREEQTLSERSPEPVTSAGIVSINMNTTPVPAFKFQPIPNSENKPQKTNEISKNYYQLPKLKSLPTQDQNKATTIRDQEAKKYNNNTLITNKNVKVYSYYWRMENFTQNIKTGNSLTMESPIFSIRGKALKIKAFFQHLHRDFLYLQLEDCSSSPQLGLGNSIILDTGAIFKEINSDNFKYKMSILDQSKKRSSDLVSQEFDNHDSGFLIPNSALIDSPFIKDDSLLIQLFLYL